ncbi:facilitated trehalose transporter Tret1-like [Melitaea cinxia]|uniref:facilitated trehalose transporter Tret1-like n=1 Tax=Melitaea cinxia TaxID=113334 RepID=UPI001E273EF0|nr:facilitated trehalose transporter Tret1-like [Melitaea cinxia]
MESEKLKKSALCLQFLATLIISNLVCLIGFIYAWPSYTYAILKSNETVLEAPMTTGELSAVGSLTNIGAFLATPFCGYALDKLGRKYAAMLFGLPFVIAWGIIAVTKSVYLVIFAVGIAGLGAGGQVVTTVYIAEICHDSIRGGLISSIIYVFFIGLLISYSLGGYLSYHHVVYVHLAQSILYIVLLAFLKESPVFLMKRGKEEEAAEAISFYHRIEINSKEMQVEIRKLKLQLDPKIIKMLESGGEDASAEKLLEKSPSTTEKEEEHVLDVLVDIPNVPRRAHRALSPERSESSRKALTTVLILMSLSIMMGSVALQVYAEPLFKEAVPTMDSNTCSIVLALVYLIACVIGAILVDKLGRKSLMTVTCAICGVLTALLGSQLHLHYAPHWFTAFLMYGFSFAYNVGGGIVPYVVTAEVFLPEVRGLGNSCVMSFTWLSNFVVLIIFTPLVEAIGLGMSFYFFSVICFLTAVYSHFYLPETKGLSVDVIQKLFLKEKRTN